MKYRSYDEIMENEGHWTDEFTEEELMGITYTTDEGYTGINFKMVKADEKKTS